MISLDEIEPLPCARQAQECESLRGDVSGGQERASDCAHQAAARQSVSLSDSRWRTPFPRCAACWPFENCRSRYRR